MYIVLAALSFLMPLAFFAAGLILHRHSPKNINAFVGYRTSRSTRSPEAWNEANSYSTKLLIRYSAILLLAVALMIALAGRSLDSMAAIMMVSVVLGLTVIIVVVVLTERRLKKMFGK